MFNRLARLLVCVAVCCLGNSLFAINLSFDDEGNSDDKNWSNAGNWEPDRVPQVADDVFIGNLANAEGDTTILDLAITIASLTLSNAADVDTNGFVLDVRGVTRLGGSFTSIFVRPRNPASLIGFSSEGIVVNSGADFRVLGETGSTDGGIVRLASGLFEINAGGNAGGHGTIQLTNASTVGQAMENSGRLFVGGRPTTIFNRSLPGTLTITRGTTGTGTLDLDGDNDDGVVDVDDGASIFGTALTLVIDVPLTDSFSGQMDIGNDDTVNMIPAWQMVQAGGDDPTVLNFNGTGTHTLMGGTLTVSGAATQINANGGTTVIDNNLTVNSGAVNVAGNATLQLNRTATFGAAANLTLGTHLVVNGATSVNQAIFNWDGSGSSTTTVNAAGALTINATNIATGGSNEFNGTINMNSGNLAVNVAGTWVMNGTLNMANTPADTPVLSGSVLDIGDDTSPILDLGGNLNVTGAGVSQINSPVRFFSDADVDVPAGATLLLNGNATFNSVNGAANSQFTGGGVLRLDGASNVVNEDTTINMPAGRVDLDGSGAAAQTLTLGTFNPFPPNPSITRATLTLNVEGIDSDDNSFGKTVAAGSDTIVLNSRSDLVVNLTDPNAEWTLNAGAVLDINAAGALGGNAGIAGSDFNMAGTTNISLGNSIWTARTDISGTVNIGFPGSFNLQGGDLNDPNRLESGTIAGAGELRAPADRALVGYGTINSDVNFAGNSRLLAAGDPFPRTLNINGALVDVGTIGTADEGGILVVANPWNTNVANVAVLLNGGQIQGAEITNDLPGGISGFGDVRAVVINNSSLNAQGGTLSMRFQASDWDGATNTGRLFADTGNLELIDNAEFPFAGEVRANSGREVFANGFALEFEPASQLHLEGGTYRSTHATDIGGIVNVAVGDPSTISVPATVVFENDSDTTLNDDLRLDNANTLVQVGADFSGGGSLVNLNGRQLTLAGGADIGVLIENQGMLAIADPGTGRADADDFLQTASGQLNIDLAGTVLGDFDRLVHNGAAQLDGTLQVSLFDDFDPALGDMFTILSAAGGVTGRFSTVNPPTLDSGLALSVVYSPTNVMLQIVGGLAGDTNGDGLVNIDDLNNVRNHFGAMGSDDGTLAGDAFPFDGLVNIDDLNAVRNNFGTGAAVPEPASVTLAALAAMLALAGTSRGLTPRRPAPSPDAT